MPGFVGEGVADPGRARATVPVYLAAAWAAGWAISTSVGVQVEDQFTVFGAAGAVTVTLLTAALPVLITTRHK